MSEQTKKLIVDWKLLISSFIFACTLGGYAITVGKQTATFEANIEANSRSRIVTMQKSLSNEKRILLIETSNVNNSRRQAAFYDKMEVTLDKLNATINNIRYDEIRNGEGMKSMRRRLQELEDINRKGK